MGKEKGDAAGKKKEEKSVYSVIAGPIKRKHYFKRTSKCTQCRREQSLKQKRRGQTDRRSKFYFCKLSPWADL